ncbi:hypothetical protein KFL_005660090 [Klebsormidium nitens]|uniref:EF-hand domain-containing protein n=1 Tax=Klebsormidium nitens TaxID=105231 RepID=A0A1Y1IG48_KLENI|nr:hypothetical protein KFL_005660090 [Klebsormidium nitens]|eukprot:GAQ89825.1 hypothetical protein KFL_005660090 [Klebsormidium nitens]
MTRAKDGPNQGTISWHSSRAVLGLNFDPASGGRPNGTAHKAPWSPPCTVREREKHGMHKNSMYNGGGSGVRDELGVRVGAGGAVTKEGKEGGKQEMRFTRLDHQIGRKIGGRLYLRASDSLVHLRNTFGSMDPAGEGRLDWQKIQEGLRQYRVELTAEEGRRVLDRLDADATGRVDYNRLLTIFAEGTPGSRPRTASNVMLTTAPWDPLPRNVKPATRSGYNLPLRDRQLYHATAAVIERRANRLRILLRRHDPGRTGRVSVNGLQQGLAALRYKLSEEQVRSFLTMAKQRDLERGIDYERLVSLFDNFEAGPSSSATGAAPTDRSPEENARAESSRARALAADLAQGKVGQILREKVAEGRKEKIMQIFRRHDMDDDGALSLRELRQSMGALLPEGQEQTARDLAGSEDDRVDYKALVAVVIREEDGGARTGRQTGMGQAMGLQARGTRIDFHTLNSALVDPIETSWTRAAMRARTTEPMQRPREGGGLFSGEAPSSPTASVPQTSRRSVGVRPATALSASSVRRTDSGASNANETENGAPSPGSLHRPSSVSAFAAPRSRFAWHPPPRDTSAVIRPTPGSPGYCSDLDRLQSVNTVRAQSATPGSHSTFSQALSGSGRSPSRKRAISAGVLQELATTNDTIAAAKQAARITRLTGQKQRYMEMSRATENERAAAATTGSQTLFGVDGGPSYVAA